MKISSLPVPAMLAALLILTVASPVRAADDTTRRAQQALRDGGFYYGPVDGTSGDETTQAVRRYQIRNGLAVSGQLNAETLRSLGINAPPPPDATGPRQPRPLPTPSRDEPTPPPLVKPTPNPTPAPTPPRTITSRPATPVPTPTPRPTPLASTTTNRPDLRAAPLPPGAQVPSAPLTGFFARTPYEFAPPAVQADVLRRAQRALGRGGFYDGLVDGQPNRGTVAALGEFQGAYRLGRTGRLDVPTLRVLRLMPDADSNLPEPLPPRRRAPEPDDEDEEMEEDEEMAPPIRIRPRRGEVDVYQGRIIR